VYPSEGRRQLFSSLCAVLSSGATCLQHCRTRSAKMAPNPRTDCFSILVAAFLTQGDCTHGLLVGRMARHRQEKSGREILRTVQSLPKTAFRWIHASTPKHSIQWPPPSQFTNRPRSSRQVLQRCTEVVGELVQGMSGCCWGSPSDKQYLQRSHPKPDGPGPPPPRNPWACSAPTRARALIRRR
jgi:hypothetical protein